MTKREPGAQNGARILLTAFAPFLAMSALGVVVCSGLFCAAGPCVRTGVRYGLWASQCPASDLRLSASVSAYGLVRGTDSGWVDITPTARWLAGDGRDAVERSDTPSRGYDWTLTLRDADGNPVPGFEVVERRRSSSGTNLRVAMPAVPDGDYSLRAVVESPYGEVTVDAPVALYAPAIVHAMTDRPLYRPGQTVLFRSAVLRRTDESPLDGRPGRWQVNDPAGHLILDEKSPAGAWGIASSSFPLDADAEQGTWKVSYVSGNDRDTVSFDVRPFRLPRLSLEVRPGRSWYGPGGDVVIEGTAKYSSGAPVADAPVTVHLRVAEGRWPLPLEWEQPFEAVTGRDGSFRIPVGMVPPDLMDLDRVSIVAEVVEAAGERVASASTMVLSHEPVHVAALTELGDGLVEGFNNRVYLRVTTPDGKPLPDADLLVKRPYDPADPGKAARTDVDGVAVLQVDPGPPVTVVTPAAPVRYRPDPAQAARVTRADSAAGSFDLDETRALDDALADITACGGRADGAHDVALTARVNSGGQVTAVVTGGDAVSRCVAARIRQARFPYDDVRTYTLGFQVPDAVTPRLRVTSLTGVSPVDAALNTAISEARPCVARDRRSGQLFDLHWTVREGSTAVGVELEALDAPGLSDACVRGALAGLKLDEPAVDDLLGAARLEIVAATRREVRAPQPTTSMAYELVVEAKSGDEGHGRGRVVLPIGQVPPMRLRATPPLAHPGDEVKVELVRGPTWSGNLPEKLQLMSGAVVTSEVKVVDKVATFVLAPDADGFLHADFAGARAVVFVTPADPLTLSLTTDAKTYEPGGSATLTLTTRRGESPTEAGVSVVGVDSMLGQLAPLLSPDDFGRVTVRATADRPAFGAFDPKALALGQIQGENAARAAVAKVTQVPLDGAGDATVNAQGTSTFDPRSEAIENFYRVLLRCADDLAAWETSAPANEQLDPRRMVQLWDGALAAVAADGHPVTDGYGRRLTLAVLPSDLLALVDPRRLVGDATRMPEDAEDFVQYVLREVK